jgi:stage V sporulation protein SpoVS
VKLIACGAALLCLTDTAFADDVIYNGLHCNILCQRWMGISPKHPTPQKRRCLDVVSAPAQFNADLVHLCQIVAGQASTRAHKFASERHSRPSEASDMIGGKIREDRMFFVNWGHDSTVGTEARDNAVDALALAEEFLAAKRPDLKIVDRATGHPITIDELRGRAKAEREGTEAPKP